MEEQKKQINLPELLPNSLRGWVINKTQEQNSFKLSIVLTFVQNDTKPKKDKKKRKSNYQTQYMYIEVWEKIAHYSTHDTQKTKKFQFLRFCENSQNNSISYHVCKCIWGNHCEIRPKLHNNTIIHMILFWDLCRQSKQITKRSKHLTLS